MVGGGGRVLMRDGMVIPPLAEKLECGTERVMVAETPKSKPRLRKIHGCHGIYTYAPQVFRPGAALALRIYEGGKPAGGGDVSLSPELVERIWADFEPWRKAVEENRAAEQLTP